MALFSRKEKNTAKAAPSPKKSTKKAVAPALPENPGAILFRPRLTEKAAILSEKGVYAFEVHPSATKKQIAGSVTAIFKVTPVSVRIVTIPRKQVRTRQTGKAGFTAGGKKAYVTLKEGDKIELV